MTINATAIHDVLEEMQKLRNARKKSPASDEQKDQYLVLAAQFSEHVNENILHAQKVRLLLDYDVAQEGYWREHNPDLATTIDRLFFTSIGDIVSDMDARHHLVQAAKYIYAASLPANEQGAVFETIQSALPPQKLNKNAQLYDIKTEDLNAITTTPVNAESLESIITTTKNHGYQYVVFPMQRKEYKKLFQNTPQQNEVIQTEYKKSKLLQLAIDKTPICTHIVFGALPARVQKYIEKKYKGFDAEKASTLEGNMEWVIGSAVSGAGAAYFATMAEGMALGLIAGATGFAAGVTVLAWYLCALRYNFDFENNATTPIVGSPFVKPFAFPAEIYVTNKKENDDDLLTIRLHLQPAQESKVSELPYIAQKQVSDEAEKNLRRSINNYHRFGKIFLEEIVKKENKKTTDENSKPKDNPTDNNKPNNSETTSNNKPNNNYSQQLIDRDNRAVIFTFNTMQGPYHRTEQLICFEGIRYYATILAEEPKNIPLNIFKEQPTAETIRATTNAFLTRLDTYTQGSKTSTTKAIQGE